MAPERSHNWRAALVVGGVYLVASLCCWAHLLRAGAASHIYALNLGDVGQGVWFIGWLPFAITHGANPFVSHYMFAPAGVNLLSNTSYFTEALILAPLTWATSPVVSFNVACIAAPVVSGGATYWVLRRFGSSVAAAGVGGLAFGFSPAILEADRVGHFNLAWMFFPPLVVYFLDRIVFRPTGSPLKLGVAFGLVTVVQFFSSPEILLDCVVVALPVVAGSVVVAFVRQRDALRSRMRHALTGSGVAVLVAGVLLAYPLWFYAAGPYHVASVSTTVSPGIALSSPVWPAEATGTGFLDALPGTPWTHRFDIGFVGPVLLLLAIAALVIARRRPGVIVMAVAAVWSFVLSWGAATGITGGSPFGWHAPVWYLAKVLPILRNVGWIRLAAITTLLVAMLAAVAIDEIGVRLRGRLANRPALPVLAVQLGLALLACVPLVLAANVPFTGFESATEPAAIGHLAATNGGDRKIVNVYPSAGVFSGLPLAWQAECGYCFRSPFGYAWRQPRPGAVGVVTSPPTAFLYISVLAPETSPHLKVSTAQKLQIRRSFRRNDITEALVVSGLPGSTSLTNVYDQIFGPGRAVPGGRIWVTSGHQPSG